MNLSERWAGFLMEAGIDAVHWASLGNTSEADHVILNYARTFGYTVLTQDLDFGTLLWSAKTKGPSVVQLRAADISPERIGADVVQSMTLFRTELEAGALITLDPRQTRIRLLPF